jgi:amino acid transporter
MSLSSIILGKPLASSEEKKEKLSVLTGVPVLGLDALASTGYGPEAALTILSTLGVAGLRYFPFVVLAVVFNLTTLYLSYQQTAAAYPEGGGTYTVVKDNLGERIAVWAAVALLIDYLLNVAVGIAAGIGAVVSAIPSLQPHTLGLCLAVLVTLTLINLRGVRESGRIFVGPVFGFVACIGVVLVFGLVRALAAGGHPHAAVPPPPLVSSAANFSPWLFFAAFANGATAMTGIEAVSNGVPLFRGPKVPNARRTLTVIFIVLTSFLLALGYLCPAYRIGAMDETRSGYQNVLSQLAAAVAGHGAFYYITVASLFIVLTFSAQTSMADFPRVCRLLAEDDYLPHAFANRGRRLVYSYGITILAVLSAVLLICFGGYTEGLIPLFAIGAFTAFLLSQIGMVVHWRRRRGPRVRVKMMCNAVGAAVTGVSLVIIVLAKFTSGAWMTVVVVPGLVLVLRRVKRHYRKLSRELEEPMEFHAGRLEPPLVIVPIESWSRAAEKAVRFGMRLSSDVTALHVGTEHDQKDRLRKIWREKIEAPARRAGITPPRLEIVESPYRLIYQPILEFVEKVRRKTPDRLVAVVIPEVVEPHWYDYLLHNLHATRLRAQLLSMRDARTVVVSTPWYLRE